MFSDTDYSLLMLKLTQFEDKLKKLEQEIAVLNGYVDTQLRNKYYPQPIPDGYALSAGNLMDSGMTQVWHNTELAKEGDDVEE